MADFDLIGRVQLELDPQTLARIERDMERVARSANKTLTTGFDAQRRGSARELRTNILQRDKFASQQGSRANLEITRRETKELEKQAQALKENILLRDKFVSFQASRANAEITRRETDQIDRQSAALRENILLRDRFVSTEAAKGNAAIVANETEQIKKQSDALRENILLRDRFITQQASRFNEIVTADTDTADAKRASSLKNNILQRDAFIAEQAARQNAEITRSEDANNKKRIDSLRNAILERAKLNKQLESQRRLSPLQNDPAFQFGQQSALAFRRFAAFSIAAGGLFTIVQTMREGISEAIKFEQQLVKLAQVSNTSVSALGNFRETIDGLSVGLGVSSSDLVQSAVTIRQAGFTLAETKAALDTLALTSLSPSFNDLKNTTEGLIALKSQFGTSADAFKREFGEINAVSKAFAVESEDIVTAIRKSGGAFKVAGGQVRELIALFTAVRSTTRESADTIATGFRTIFARLQRPQIIDELKQFNIELRDSEGNFVGPLKAIEEINKALGDIGSSGDLQFARIAEQIGGIRQISKVVPLIQQFATAQRAANIELLGQNSLAEDADIAQQSLANRLTKTKENFLAFARDLTINDQFKELSRGILTLADAVVNFGRVIAPVLPSLISVFALSQLGNVGKFGAGFAQRLSGQKHLFNQRGFATGLKGNPFISRRQALLLGANLPNLGALAGIGISSLGSSIADVDPTKNRKQFLAGRAVEGAGSGLTTGAIFGASIGTAISGPGLGTVVGGALGAATGALLDFKDALHDAQDALEESEFRPSFDALSQTLALVGGGRINPLGQRDKLTSGFAAIRARNISATGVERDQLRGDVRQTVESLLLFNEKLIGASKSLEDFIAQGGGDAIKFIAENSQLAASELEKQARTAIEARQKEEAISRRLLLTQEKLVNQANLISAFGAALADATSKANDMSQRFNFVANNLLGAGAVGVEFRGVAGFQDIFSRPGQISNLGLLGGAANQVTGLLGPQFAGLGQQAVAISDILRQLPSIISEFAIQRPTGNIDDSIDVFVRSRLNNIAKNIPGGAIKLEPIIDSIANSITSEISKQGGGQADAIQKILDAPASFIQTIIGNSGFEQVFSLFNDAATRFTERFNVYAEQFAQLSTKEIQTREQIVNLLSQRSDRFAQVARIRNPDKFPLGTLQQTKVAQQLALLGPNIDPNVANGLVNNPNGIRTVLGGVRSDILAKEAALQKSTEVQESKNLIKEIIYLQSEASALGQAFDLAADKSNEIAAKFDEIEKIQLGRDQLKQGFDRFLFGTNAERQQLNRAAIATQLVSIDPRKFFDPRFITDTLRGEILDLAQTFSERRVPGFFGFNQNGTGRTGNEFLDFIRQFGAKQFGAPQNILDDLKKGPNKAQEELLKGIEDLATEEFATRLGFIIDERNNILFLINSIDKSLDDFVKDLRVSLLEQQKQTTQNRINAIAAEQAPLKKQIDQFRAVIAEGGFADNTTNQTVLREAIALRKIDKTATQIELFANKPNAFTGELSRGGGGTGRIRPEDAQEIGIRGIRRILGNNLGLTDLDPFINQFQDRVSKLRDESSDRNNLSGELVANAFDIVIKEGIAKAREQNKEQRKAFNERIAGFNEQQRDFIVNLNNLDPIKFHAISTAINELGDAKLDKVTEQFNSLNREAQTLASTLADLTNKINGVKPPVPAGARPDGTPIRPNTSGDSVSNPIIQRNLEAAAQQAFLPSIESVKKLKEQRLAQLRDEANRNQSQVNASRFKSSNIFELGIAQPIAGIDPEFDKKLRRGDTNFSIEDISNVANIASRIRVDSAVGSKTALEQRSRAIVAAQTASRLDQDEKKLLEIFVQLRGSVLDSIKQAAADIQAENNKGIRAEENRKAALEEANRLEKTKLEDLQKLKGVLDIFTKGVSAFNTTSPQLIKSMDNFPRSIEMAGNHKVEVIINGAQVLAQLQPGIERLVVGEVEKALNKFAANNLPGVGSFA